MRTTTRRFAGKARIPLLVGAGVIVAATAATVLTQLGVTDTAAGSGLSTATAACTSASIDLHAGKHGVVEPGTYGQEIVVHNHSTTGCLLSGYPGVSDSAGAAVSSNGPNVLNQTQGILAPGQTAQFAIVAPVSCAAPQRNKPALSNANVALPGNGGTIAVSGLAVNTACGGAKVTPLGINQNTPVTDPLANVSLRMSVPHTAPAGSLVSYTVTLTNTTKSALSLGACPSFTLGTFSGTVTQTTGRLACGSGSLPAGGTIVTHGQFRMPKTSSEGSAVKVFWMLQTPSKPSAGALMQIAD